MKSTIRTTLVVLAIVVALTAIHTVCAEAGRDCSVTVEGTVTAIDYEAQTLDVDGHTIKGVPFTYLANQWDIALVEGESYVVITAHTCLLTGDLRACTVSVDGGPVIDFPGR